MRITVIGATGQIGARVVRTALQSGHQVTGVSHHTPSSPPTEWRAVDAADPDQLADALEGADVAIATLGLPYRIDTWTTQWPPLARSVTSAVRATSTPLVWLDNCYLYGLTRGPVTEDAPVAPCSRMGQARAEGFSILREAGEHTPVVVARAADFIGPGVETTLVPWSGLARAADPDRRGGVRLPWIGDPETSHSYASADEVARGLLTLAEDRGRTPGDLWHLPALRPVTGREICDILSRLSGNQVRPLAVPKGLLGVAGWFSPLARASNDMGYLSQNGFLLDDSRFRTAFGAAASGDAAGTESQDTAGQELDTTLEALLERELGGDRTTVGQS